MLLTWRLPSTKSGRSPDGLHVNEISFEGTNIIHVRGRVFCLPSGTEPIAAVFKVDPDEQRLTSYSLRYGNKSEPPAVKAERRIHKAPTDADRWDFEFDWP
jgi:hypothetical protein